MSETNDLTPVDVATDNLPNDSNGIVAALGTLGPGAIVTAEGLARLFQRHAASLERAVLRGML